MVCRFLGKMEWGLKLARETRRRGTVVLSYLKWYAVKRDKFLGTTVCVQNQCVEAKICVGRFERIATRKTRHPLLFCSSILQSLPQIPYNPGSVFRCWSWPKIRIHTINPSPLPLSQQTHPGLRCIWYKAVLFCFG